MHYIRFLKPPLLSLAPAQKNSSSTQQLHLTAKITITSDLGDSFLYAEQRIRASIIGADGACLAQNSRELHWKAGMRELLVEVPVVERDVRRRGAAGLEWPCRLVVVGVDEGGRGAEEMGLVVLGEEGGRVLGVESEGLERRVKAPVARRVLRRLRFGERGGGVEVWEETGESIARHIWDAGLILASYLYTFKHSPKGRTPRHLVQLRELLAKPTLKAVELGAGCGIVGITLAHYFPHSTILLTDLPEAEEIARHNIARNSPTDTRAAARLTYRNLDWASPLPVTLQAGDVDLVLVADCTYNPDVVPHLVTTLARLLERNRQAVVLLAMKVRHDSEAVFFDLMQAEGMRVVEKLVLPLPMLGLEAQEIEMYLFSKD